MRLVAKLLSQLRLPPQAGAILEATDLTAAILGETGMGKLLVTVKPLLHVLEDPGSWHEAHVQEHESDET
jgi:hypothetical protein